MKTLITIAAVAFLVAFGVVGFVYSGVYDVSASSSQNGVTYWLLSTTSHESIERHARAIDVPDLDDESLVLAGVNDFDAMCAGCHGAPGRQPDAMGQGLNPPPPDLAEEAGEMTPAELFWVTKNGIRMTGMPAWGVTHDDAAIWPVVAFMTKLPGLDEASYRQMLAAAEDHGHHSNEAADEDHADSEDHEHGDTTEPEIATDAPEAHDHSTHEHNDG